MFRVSDCARGDETILPTSSGDLKNKHATEKKWGRYHCVLQATAISAESFCLCRVEASSRR